MRYNIIKTINGGFVMNYIETYEHWLNSTNIDTATRDELEAMKGNDAEIKERFYCELEFGTAGLRGVLGAGINRMNKYLVRKTTKGYAEYIKSVGEAACKRGIVIATTTDASALSFVEKLRVFLRLTV